MKIEKITITSEELDIIREALEEYEQSFRDFQDDCPDEMSDEELYQMCNRIRSICGIFDDIEGNSPLTVEVKQS